MKYEIGDWVIYWNNAEDRYDRLQGSTVEVTDLYPGMLFEYRVKRVDPERRKGMTYLCQEDELHQHAQGIRVQLERK